MSVSSAQTRHIRSAQGASKPRVTVVIPCYNYGHFLTECVASVLSQDCVDVDAIVVDDASTDDSVDVARRLAANNPRVQVIRHAQNMGHIATYNDGLRRAQGEYVVLLSADDLLTPGSLARATAVLVSQPDVGLVYGNPLVFYDKIPPARARASGYRVWKGADWITAQCRRGLSIIYCPEVVVRASVQRAVGDYSASLPHTADLEMWLRVAAVADIARINGSDQAYRRIHGGSMMQTHYAEVLADLRGRLKAYEAFFEQSGVPLRNASRDLTMARRRLAEEALVYACNALREGKPDVTDYVAFAAQLQGSNLRRLPQWREYQLLGSAGRPPKAMARLLVGCLSARRELTARYRWHRWRAIGI